MGIWELSLFFGNISVSLKLFQNEGEKKTKTKKKKKSCWTFLRNLCRIWSLLLTSVETTLIQDIIISHLDYCNNLLIGLFVSVPASSVSSAVAGIILF